MFPGPRYIRLGPHSGEEFRQNILIPAIEQNREIVINLDGTFGYGSSFLEEAFGGLVRKGIDKDIIIYIRDNLISNDDPTYITEIKEYIDDALKEENK
ncbi:STAS-like domain-containing protein (plasmid) [Vibrio alfacsensis]|uniref:STAS-like domain-containing protein n=1 Tax=Vibrio alfacsensis TaxID=1074311 RepID=UPI002ADE2E27|nr:STAS-like domain-containing protein [Vibrio alfacsensis]WQE79476.1 STAS-like domain-containing protein [Vibrio alfacsensis]